jgi:hypothetical protein
MIELMPTPEKGVGVARVGVTVGEEVSRGMGYGTEG